MAGRKQTKATRKKISEAHKKLFLEEAAVKPLNVQMHKRCSRCEELKPVTLFHTERQKLASGLIAVYPTARCKKCTAELCKERRDRQIEEGVDVRGKWREYRRREDPEDIRRRGREYAANRRRKEGRPVRGSRMKEREADPRLPAAPLARLLKTEIAKHGMEAIVSFTGLDERQLRGIRELECASVKLSTADRIFTGLGYPEKIQELYPIEEPEKLVGWHYLDPKGLLSAQESV